MSNNTTKINKNKLTGKKMGILAAAALTATLIGGSVPVVTEPVSAAEAQESTSGTVIPDNITIDQPTELANVSLPITEYGTFEWADGSFVPTEKVQACEVLLIPGEGQDLSHVDGWNPEAGAVVGYINVVVNGSDDADKEKTDDAEAPSEDPEITETPSETPAAEKEDKENKDIENDKKSADEKENKDNSKEETGDTKDETKNDKDSSDEEVTGKLEPVEDPEQDKDNTEDTSDDKNSGDDNIFDNPVLPDEKDDRPTDAEDDLSEEEKEARAEVNHTCDGITVSGINLPWYVQFRVSSGDSYQFTNESDAMIFQSYEFELWDLQNDTEYEIPSGEYISVTVPVKSGYQYTIEHLLDNGATETIIPSVDDNIMVFSTHSFSPFGIAGSRQLVGPDGGEDTDASDSETVTPTPTSAANSTSAQEQSSNSESTGTVSVNDDSDNSSNASSSQTDNTAANETTKNNNAVNTGDTTTILPFVILVAAAAVIIGVVIFIKKKKK